MLKKTKLAFHVEKYCSNSKTWPTFQQSILPYPIQNKLTTPMRAEANRVGNIEFMSLWAGQAAYLCKALPAAQLIAELDRELRQQI